MTNKLKSIDLFAGIGGIRLGFEKAFGPELETSFVSEWDQHAQKTYRANFSDDFEIAGDITKIDEKGMLQNSTFVGLALPLFLITFFSYLVWLQFFPLLKPVNYSSSRWFLECFRR